jgi:hypothetical protein
VWLHIVFRSNTLHSVSCPVSKATIALSRYMPYRILTFIELIVNRMLYYAVMSCIDLEHLRVIKVKVYLPMGVIN